jgi:transglutaminase-like putative cysteine protease
VAAGALDLMHRIHADFEFQSASTEVDTPLIEAFEQRAGVCQDFAHLMIAALRMLGLAARYVSGYLLTQPPPGQAKLLGADASHAWVQVYCPDTPGLPGGWLELDPTNDLIPDTSHVRLALGRDYGDVTPLRGVIRGGGQHTLGVAVNTRRVQQAQARMLLS